ncbi:MAG: IPTL-CTERM sorting domain-containing protein [Betaproteobacteria bacterium]|nr:IPTL-CTERM sorting domain-containing protein [Betaproteobacteria bacterium]
MQAVRASRSVVANFLPTISTGVTPPGGGSVHCTPNPVHIGGASTCFATSAPGFAFAAWTGHCTGLDPQCQLTAVTAPRAVTANFVEVFTSKDGTNAAVPWVQVVGGNGWALTSGDDPNRPTLGWIPLIGSPNAPAPPPPPGVDMIYGLLSTSSSIPGVVGSTAQVTITYPDPLPPGTQYWKYNRTTQVWYHLDPSRYAVSGNTITLTLTDGGIGDNDGAANGFIVDPGGPALRELLAEPLPAREIPALQTWALVLLAGMLAVAGIRRRRR